MTSKILTATAVKNFRPGTAPRQIPDGGCVGLYLIVYPSGRKTWAMRFRRRSFSPKEGSSRSKARHVALMNEQRLLAQLPADSPRRKVSLPPIKLPGGGS